MFEYIEYMRNYHQNLFIKFLNTAYISFLPLIFKHLYAIHSNNGCIFKFVLTQTATEYD